MVLNVETGPTIPTPPENLLRDTNPQTQNLWKRRLEIHFTQPWWWLQYAHSWEMLEYWLSGQSLSSSYLDFNTSVCHFLLCHPKRVASFVLFCVYERIFVDAAISKGFLWRLKWLNNTDCLQQCLAHKKHCINVS